MSPSEIAVAEPLANVAEFTVSELSHSLKRMIEDNFGYVRVRGEITGYRGPHSSGHAYFALKDEGAKIEAVIWRGVMGKLRFRPEEGMEVIATGKLTTYPGSSKYQIVIEALEPAGVGALMALLEERKKKLGAEGLFDAERKQLIPYMPRVIGVITSPTGAVIRDILHRLADRFPTRVVVWPVRVQGETSAREVANAIDGFNALAADGSTRGIPRPDVIIVARGGGSLEDLWGFNEEIVVRAAAASDIPLIAAVGHETDWTLIDLAADLRAPTPTGAAEMAVPVRADLLTEVETLGLRLSGGMRRQAETRRAELRSAARALPRLADLIGVPRQRLDMAASRLAQALVAATRVQATRLARVAGRLTPMMLTRAVVIGRERLLRLSERSARATGIGLERRRAVAQGLAARLSPQALLIRVERGHERADGAGRRLDRAFTVAVQRRRHSLDGLAKLLASLSYQSVLTRGFALVRDASGRPVHAAAGISAGAALELEFRDGRVDVVAVDAGDPGERPTPRRPTAAASAETAAAPAPRPKPARREPASGTGQGSLF